MDEDTPETERVQVSSSLSRATRRRLRIYCASTETQMQDVYEQAITAWLDARGARATAETEAA